MLANGITNIVIALRFNIFSFEVLLEKGKVFCETEFTKSVEFIFNALAKALMV